jgi:hypothetical protein
MVQLMYAGFVPFLRRASPLFGSNSIGEQTFLKPCEETERTLRTSVAPFTEVSMGKVTKRSTSSDAIPCASVITTTVGEVKSGNTSTSIFMAVLIPITTNNTELSKIKYLLFSENFIILLSMSVLL